MPIPDTSVISSNREQLPKRNKGKNRGNVRSSKHAAIKKFWIHEILLRFLEKWKIRKYNKLFFNKKNLIITEIIYVVLFRKGTILT